VMPDSSILRSPRDLYLPQASDSELFTASAAIMFRTGRMGKCVARRFAHRYYDAMTAGWVVNRGDGSNALDRAFDGALLFGEWLPITDFDDALRIPLRWQVNGETVATAQAQQMRMGMPELTEWLTQRLSYKMGDIVIACQCATVPLSAGKCLQAWGDDTPLMEMKVF